MLEQPGLLKKVQGIGWYLDEANIAQVSTNILDYELTPLHSVYEEVCRDAEVRQQSTRPDTPPYGYLDKIHVDAHRSFFFFKQSDFLEHMLTFSF